MKQDTNKRLQPKQFEFFEIKNKVVARISSSNLESVSVVSNKTRKLLNLRVDCSKPLEPI